MVPAEAPKCKALQSQYCRGAWVLVPTLSRAGPGSPSLLCKTGAIHEILNKNHPRALRKRTLKVWEGILCVILLLCVCLSPLSCHTDLELADGKCLLYSPSGLASGGLELSSHFRLFHSCPSPRVPAEQWCPALVECCLRLRLHVVATSSFS